MDVEPADFNEHFPNASPEAIDLMKKILVLDPDNRITVDQALDHPFFNDLHVMEDEPIMEELS